MKPNRVTKPHPIHVRLTPELHALVSRGGATGRTKTERVEQALRLLAAAEEILGDSRQ